MVTAGGEGTPQDDDGADADLREADTFENEGQMTEGSDLGDMLFGTDEQDESAARADDDGVADDLRDNWLDDDEDVGDQGDPAALAGSDTNDVMHLAAAEGATDSGGADADPFETGTETAEDADPDAVDFAEEDAADSTEADAADAADDSLPCITDFQCGTDRLILEFDGTEDDAPEIGFDTESMPDSTLVLANGVPAAMLVGVSSMGPDDVVVQMLGAEDGSGFDGETIDGGDGDDTLTGSEGDDSLDGNDLMDGGTGDDAITGGPGDDTIEGGDGTDVLVGGAGDDVISGGAQGDLLFGGEGDDLLEGEDGDDYLQGGFGADTLSGGAGNDQLDGTFAAGDSIFGPHDEDAGDSLDGGDGDDTLVIGADDVATGGEGADTFVSDSFLEIAEIAGHVSDFDPGRDVIEVMFDPELTPDPIITVENFVDGSGANILFEGQLILRVSGAQGLDPAQIELREVETDPVPEMA
jgi:Ca2+-binding RTX toxin-like protein